MRSIKRSSLTLAAAATIAAGATMLATAPASAACNCHHRVYRHVYHPRGYYYGYSTPYYGYGPAYYGPAYYGYRVYRPYGGYWRRPYHRPAVVLAF